MSCFTTGSIPTPPPSNSPQRSWFEMPLPDQRYEWAHDRTDANRSLHAHSPNTPMIYSSHGLGLGGLPVATSQAFLESGVIAEQPEIALDSPWSSQYSFAQAPMSHPQPIKSVPTWPESSCNPLSTLMPAALWDVPQPALPQRGLYEASPIFRQYSPGEYHSAISTPYARSDSVLPSASSPQIKIEGVASPSVASTGHSSDHVSPDHPLIIQREDLRSTPIHSVEERTETLLMPSPHFDDSDPYAHSGRPVRRRAFSSADVLEDRKKRSYTKPGDAKCSCEQCGKLFQRTYNLKAHLETHDPHRVQPHTCAFEKCNKRFVRRTDLLRHQQSVSLQRLSIAARH